MLGILAFGVVVSYINADEGKLGAMQFKEFLQGSIVGSGEIREYGPWVSIRGELITGTGTGNLLGSPIEFTIVSNRRVKVDDEKSFQNGSWKFVSSDGSQISGILVGKGITLTEFSGMFVSNESSSGTGIYYGITIKGMFSCRFLPPQTYGGFWRYEAWWNGTLRTGES